MVGKFTMLGRNRQKQKSDMQPRPAMLYDRGGRGHGRSHVAGVGLERSLLVRAISSYRRQITLARLRILQ